MRTLRRRLLGLLLIAVLVGGVTLSIALYNNAFTSYVNVKLEASDIGNQLLEQSDVKVRGLIVGSVKSISATQDGAELSLALDPASAKMIPANVSARFLPKTLFGERYVSLEIPQDASTRTLRNGDVIPEDRTQGAVQLSKALDDLLPVLQAVQPQKLSATLTAISTALQGRGDELGQTLSDLGNYLDGLNPHLPELQHNLQALAKFSNNLSNTAPDLVQTLDNLSTTSKTIVDEQQNLQSLYADVTTASQTLESFVRTNSSNLISLARSSRPTAELLAKYSPEYPCLFGGMADLVPLIDQAMGKGTSQPGLHATIEIVVNRGPYEPGRDEPRFEDKRGPRCYDMKDFPQPFPQYPPDGPIKDGSQPTPGSRVASDGLVPANTAANAGGYNGGGTTAGNPANTPAEQDFLDQLVGPQVGLSAQQMPGWSGLLIGPLYRGAEVTIK
ncbi:MCE family protein [Amycolatopsis acidiphila]|uniref:MCE family protein n=1 Tax=Amycolatopsis acidiphila TaxID=715473 RepID=A0A557ZPJ2_9PSEU|nr:MCE family protein [Amycolatopsis acidiphila]TVT13908.1 MCE family protein [Amycolatopsis acidiphila]UIJ60665.1 MCE family protein [Amycolatopsis acidiphila]GHG91556.1 ABC transporter substrate-binding protein [Amycolatopsis acidiphila]